MTKTAIYQTIYAYLMDTGSARDENGTITAKYTPGAFYPQTQSLVSLLSALREDMRTEANKASGKADIEKAMRAVIKGVDDKRPMLQGAFEDGGRQCVCDGYRAIRLNNAIDLPAPPVPCSFDLARVFEGMTAAHREPLELPTVAELKSLIKIGTAENRAKYGRNAKHYPVMYDWGNGKPAVNAAYLLDILTAFPDARATAGRPIDPIYFEFAAGDAVLLPIKKQAESVAA